MEGGGKFFTTFGSAWRSSILMGRAEGGGGAPGRGGGRRHGEQKKKREGGRGQVECLLTRSFLSPFFGVRRLSAHPRPHTPTGPHGGRRRHGRCVGEACVEGSQCFASKGTAFSRVLFVCRAPMAVACRKRETRDAILAGPSARTPAHTPRHGQSHKHAPCLAGRVHRGPNQPRGRVSLHSIDSLNSLLPIPQARPPPRSSARAPPTRTMTSSSCRATSILARTR